MAESTNTKGEVHPHDVLIGYLSESCPLGISYICPTRKTAALFLAITHACLVKMAGHGLVLFCFSIYLELLVHKNAKNKDMDNI